MALPRLAERLLLLQDYGQGLLAAVYNFKMRFEVDQAKPKIINDPNLAPVFKAMAKRFPDLGGLSQIPNASIFEMAKKEIVDNLGEFYMVFVNVIEFKEAALVCLNDCTSLVKMTPELNVDIMEQFLRLVATYFRINYLISLIEDRKLVVAVFARAYQVQNNFEEPNYSRIAQYIMKFENPVDVMQQEFRAVSGRLGDVLLNLRVYLDQSLLPIAMLRQAGDLNIIANPNNIKKPSGEEKKYGYLSNHLEIVDWLVYGYLLCPSELNKPAAVELMKSTLQSGFVVDLYRGDPFQFHNEFENLVNKMNSKPGKQMVSDATPVAITATAVLHFERREFLRLQLQHLLSILKDKPGLAAPKFSQIIAAIGMGRDEVLWYFHHVDQQAPSKKYKVKEDDFRDLYVGELMFLVDEIKNHILANKHLVQNYYAEYLHGYYLQKLETIKAGFSPDIDNVVRKFVDATIDALASINPGGDIVSLEALRLNWSRMQVHLSLPQTSVNASSYKDILPLMSDIVARSRYYDIVDQHINNTGGLQNMLYYRQQMITLMNVIIKHPVQARYVSVVPSIIKDFPTLISPFVPREAYPIGNKSVQLMDLALTEITKRIVDLAHEIALTQVGFAHHGAFERAAIGVKETRDAREGKSAQNDKKNQGPLFKDTLPGIESKMRPNDETRRLHSLQQEMKNLLRVVQKFDNIVVFDTQFSPAQYLREALGSRINGYISNSLKISHEDTPSNANVHLIKRPSSVLLDIETYLGAMQTIEFYVDIKLQVVIKEVLVDNIDSLRSFKAAQHAAAAHSAPAAGRKQAPAPPGAPGGPEAAPLAFSYAAWYCDTLVQRLTSNAMIISPNRRAIVSRHNAPFKSEKYYDFSELVAFVETVGPNGVRLLDQRIMGTVKSLTNDLRALIDTNRDILEELSKFYGEPRGLELAKKIKQIDQFAEKAIGLGTLLSFRSLVSSATELVLNRKAPHIYMCIDNAHIQYTPNYYGLHEILPLDTLANVAGIYRNVDTSLRATVSGLNRELAFDRKIYSYLPFMAAAALVSLSSNDSAAYNPVIDSHENNAGSFAIAINRLTVATLSTVWPPEEGEGPIIISQTLFLKCAATLLMRLELAAQRPVQLDAAYIVLNKFVQESKFISMDEFNSLLPYSIVRLAFSDAHKRVPKKKINKRAEDEMLF